jgi:phosphoglycolate phosphatase
VSHRGALLFDLDGTLLDTAPDFARELNRLRREDGLAPLPYPRVRATVSNGARALVTLSWGLREGDAAFARQHGRLLERYAEGLADETRPFPGIGALPGWCHGERLAWGVVTNKPLRFTAPLLERMEFEYGPHAVVCPDHVQRTKPDPEALLLAADWLGLAPASCIYVGDHPRDVAAGHAAGMATVAVRWGYFDDGEDLLAWGADHVIDSVTELQRIVTGHFGA